MFARVKPLLPTVALVVLILYFIFHGLTGELGWLLSSQRQADLKQLQADLHLVQERRNDLEVRAKLLRDEQLSRDLVEERARSLLGFAGPSDYVIRITP